MPARLSSVRPRVRGAAALMFVSLVACRSTPGEAPPLAPRPDPIDPTATPVPGAPGPGTPLDPHAPGPILPSGGDAGVPITSVQVSRSSFQPGAAPMQGADAGPPPDAGAPSDAGARPDAGPPSPADALDPGTPSDAATLPPTVPDALLPIDAGRPTR